MVEKISKDKKKVIRCSSFSLYTSCKLDVPLAVKFSTLSQFYLLSFTVKHMPRIQHVFERCRATKQIESVLLDRMLNLLALLRIDESALTVWQTCI